MCIYKYILTQSVGLVLYSKNVHIVNGVREVEVNTFLLTFVIHFSHLFSENFKVCCVVIILFLAKG